MDNGIPDATWPQQPQQPQPQPQHQQVVPSPLSLSLNSEIHRHLVNIAIVRLHEFHDLISMRMHGSTLEYRRMAMADYFTPAAQVSVSLNLANDPRHYTFSYFLLAHLSSEMASGEVALDLSCKLVRAKVLQNGSTSLESPKFTSCLLFNDGSQLIHRGTLKVHINPDLRIERYDICVESKTTMVDAETIEKFLKNANESDSSVTSPPGLSLFEAGNERISKYGIQDSTLRLMQIGDVMSLMKPLMTFHSNSGYDSPLKSFESFNASINRESKNRKLQLPNPDLGVSPRTVTPRDSSA